MILYCIRHGQAENNPNHIINEDPKKEINLTELGKKQAEKAAQTLKKIKFDIIITSEFPRTKETAEIINKYHHTLTIIDSRINDFISGVEGESVHVYRTERERLAKEQGIDIFNVKINDGESFEDQRKRISLFLKYLERKDYRIVLIVAHSDTLQIINQLINNLSDKEMLEFKPKNCKIRKFEL
ncbi:MAG: histidine phosphatase family protein [Nanoarchaeota archaeon]|nr:histidine phosphatase family protein [Nanoarchaeota archaeon]